MLKDKRDILSRQSPDGDQSWFDELEQGDKWSLCLKAASRHVQPWDSSMIECHLAGGFIDLFDLRGNSRGRLRNCDDWNQSDYYKESEALQHLHFHLRVLLHLTITNPCIPA